MKKVLIFAAVAEAATGLALLIIPSLVGRLLFGEELTGVAIPVARVAGIALIALGTACWPGPPRVGMLTYGSAVTLYLAYLGFAGGLTGILLWPAVALHAILTALLIRESKTCPRWPRLPPMSSCAQARRDRRNSPDTFALHQIGDLVSPNWRRASSQVFLDDVCKVSEMIGPLIRRAGWPSIKSALER